MDKLQKAQELEQEAQQLRNEAHEEERKAELKIQQEFRNKEFDVYTSDDYCGLEVGKYKFYYGYEETSFCPKHGIEDCFSRFDCPENEWAFTVKVDGKEVMRLSKSKLHPEKNEVPFWYLVAGIGHFLKTL